MYHSVDQARMRLSGCIVKLNGEWVFVRGVDSDDEGAVVMCTIPAGKPLLDDEDKHTYTILKDGCGLDASPMKLGYVISAGGWVYVYRVPHRRWKQGLHCDNLRGHNRYGGRVFNSKYLIKCLNNDYMTLKQAIKGEGAFNRYFAILGGNLWYRGTMCGSVKEDGTLSLTEKYQYLQQQLQRAMK